MFTTDQSLRLDLVIRTSQRKKEARSPEQQESLARSCADVHGYSIAKVHDSGKSESGKTMDRASIRDAMERVRAGETDGIIVALTDRLGRAPIEETMATVRELNAIGGKFVPADAGGRPVDLTDGQAETNLVLQLQMARQFWLTAAKRFKQSQTDAVARGAWIGRAPFGYVRPHKGRPMVIDEASGAIVREAFRIAAADGLHAVIAYMKDRVPERRWRTDEVRRMLRCRAYLGESVSGELRNEKAHPPLTTPALWHAAQTDARHRATNGDYCLSHVAHCECGGAMVGAMQTSKGRKYRRMRCSTCQGTSIAADAFERYVRDEVKEAIRGKRFELRFVTGDLDAAKAQWDFAADEVVRYSRDTEYRNIVGHDAWLEGARERRRAVNDAKDAYEAMAAENGRVIELPTPAQLDDDSKLVRAIRLAGLAIVVRGGRGAVDERVSFSLVHDDDDRTGVLAA